MTDEPNVSERKQAMGFFTITIVIEDASMSKQHIRSLLGHAMNLNYFTWILIIGLVEQQMLISISIPSHHQMQQPCRMLPREDNTISWLGTPVNSCDIHGIDRAHMLWTNRLTPWATNPRKEYLSNVGVLSHLELKSSKMETHCFSTFMTNVTYNHHTTILKFGHIS